MLLECGLVFPSVDDDDDDDDDGVTDGTHHVKVADRGTFRPAEDTLPQRRLLTLDKRGIYQPNGQEDVLV